MKNFKLTIGFAISGFLISLIFGLFSSSKFIKVILFALLFGLIFAGLSILIQFVYDKFLVVDGEDDSSAGASVSSSADSGTQSNHKVNIIIQDEELEQTGNSNHFDVGNNHQMLNESDMRPVENAKPVETTANQYVPIRDKETVDNFSGVEAVAPNETRNGSVNGAADSNSQKRISQAEQMIQDDDSLDVLPDMSELDLGGNSKSNNDDIITGNDSDDSLTSYSSGSNTSRNENAGEIQDAAIMAKAISSILSNDS